MYDRALLSWEYLNTCLPMERSEWIPCFALLVMLLLHLLNCLYLKAWAFSLLPFWFSPPSHCAGCEWLCGVWLQAGVVGWIKPLITYITLLSMKKQLYLPTQKVRAVFCKLKSCQCFCTKCYISTGKYLDFQLLLLHALLRNLQHRRSSKMFTGRMLKNSQCPKDSLDQTTDILLILLSLFLPGL